MLFRLNFSFKHTTFHNIVLKLLQFEDFVNTY